MATKFSIKFHDEPILLGLDRYKMRLISNGRYAVQKGAQLIHDEAKRLVPVKTGLLRSAIYHTYSADNSVPGETVVYHVGWNMRKAPHGHLIEYGHWSKKITAASHYGPIQPHWVPAHPFLRPAFYGKVALALQEIKVRLSERLGGEQ